MRLTILLSLFLTASAVAQTVTISTPVFAGSGLNDATKCGAFTSAAANEQFVATLSATGTPDHFTWTKNGGSASSPVAITGACQVMADGVGIQFAATTGHALAANWTISATASGSAASSSFVQAGVGAMVTRKVEDKLRDSVSVKDFGAVCNGVRDDTAAVQAAYTSGASIVTFPPGGACGISATVYVPQTTISMTGQRIEGSGWLSGLVALSGSSPFQMLRVYQQGAMLDNFYLNCNHVATSGLVVASASQSNYQNILAQYCTGDGIEVNPSATPVTTLTSALTAGSGPGTTFTVASNSLPGITFGVFGCTQAYFEYGVSGKQEQVAVSSPGGTALTLQGTVAHAHANGSSIQCAGNNDNAYFYNLNGGYNAGWGFEVFAGSDSNGVISIVPQMFNNFLGGELWSGDANKHYGGHSEGNSGPNIQVGDSNGGGSNYLNGRASFGFEVGPLGDSENSNPTYSTTATASSGSVTITIPASTDARFPRIGQFVAGAHVASGSQVIAVQGNPATIITFDAAHATTGVLSGGSVTLTSNNNILLAVCDSAGDYRVKPTEFFSGSGANSCLDGVNSVTMGATVNGSGGSIIAVKNSQGQIDLDPAGGFITAYDQDGNLIHPAQGGQFTLPVDFLSSLTERSPANWATECTGAGTPLPFTACTPSANNMLSVGLLDSTGNPIPLSTNFPVIKVLIGHSLAAGNGNTISVNGGGATHILSVCTSASIGQAVSAGGIITLDWYNPGGYWQMEGNCPTLASGITALTGDVTATGPGSVAATLATSGVTAGTYGSGSTAVVPQITVDAKGRITSATTAGLGGQVTAAFGTQGALTARSPANLATECTGAGTPLPFTACAPSANDALTVGLLDSAGNAVPVAGNVVIKVQISHSLAAGNGNTISVNGGGAAHILSVCTSAGIGQAVSANTVITLDWYNPGGYWLLEGDCPVSASTITAGAGLSGGGSVSPGGTVTLTNAGVRSINGATGALSGATVTDTPLTGCTLNTTGNTACTNAACTTTTPVIASLTFSCSSGSFPFSNGLHQ